MVGTIGNSIEAGEALIGAALSAYWLAAAASILVAFSARSPGTLAVALAIAGLAPPLAYWLSISW
ncbi:hypothetical protein [Nocardia sp. NPDC004123]